MRTRVGLSAILGLSVALASSAEARPYYAAKKGLSCAACHVAPSGAGMRKTTEQSPVKFSDSVSLGADLRAYFERIQGTKSSTVKLGRSAFYASAEPRPGLQVVFHADDEATVQAYGLWRSQGEWPLYVRAGRFWLPYGIQWDDIDFPSQVNHRTGAYASGKTFDMSPSSDIGVEAGLAPKDKYFLNLALTNGRPGGGGDADEGKAITARGGLIAKRFMLGASLYRNRTSITPTGSTELSFGPIAWARLGPAVLIYEMGFGRSTANLGGARTPHRGHIAELDVEPRRGWLAKFRFDSLDPNTKLPKNSKQRYAFSVERLTDWLSLEAQFRVRRENPSLRDDQFLLESHFWF